MTRFGMGYDVHRLVEGRKLILGGVDVPYEKGLLGHSDADVLLHAVSDAREYCASARCGGRRCQCQGDDGGAARVHGQR